MRKGFTLFETMVALALGSAVALLVHLLLSAAIRTAQSLSTHWTRYGERRVAARWLEDAFLSLSAGRTGDLEFVGSHNELQGTAWLLVPQGWREPGRLTLRQQADSAVLFSEGRSQTIARQVARLELAYGAGRGQPVVWASGWQSPVSVPLAIRIIIRYRNGASDTTVYLTSNSQ